MELRVQLKVCEGCGNLWYRPMCLGSAYCRKCELKLSEFPIHLENRPRRAAQLKESGRKRPLPAWTRRPPLQILCAVAQSSGGAE